MPSILREHSHHGHCLLELLASGRRHWTFNTRKQPLPRSSMGTHNTIKCMTCNISWCVMKGGCIKWNGVCVCGALIIDLNYNRSAKLKLFSLSYFFSLAVFYCFYLLLCFCTDMAANLLCTMTIKVFYSILFHSILEFTKPDADTPVFFFFYGSLPLKTAA